MKQDWVFIRMGGDHYKCECERCNCDLRVMLPVGIEDFIDAMNSFGNRHRRCRPTLQSERLQLLRTLRRRAKETGSFTFTMGVK